MPNQLILVPSFLDQPRPKLEALAQPDWLIVKPTLPEGELQARLSVIHEQLAQAVADAELQGKRPVAVVGDCCAAIGMLAGLQRAGLDPTLLWLDAHGDFNTWETTPSGFLGGMPLAMIVGRGEQTMPQAVGLKSLPESQVIFSDGRDLDLGEVAAFAASRVIVVKNVRDLLTANLGNRPIYVHFDADIVNADEIPAMNYPARGGTGAAEVGEVLAHLAATGRVAAISMTAWETELDTEGASARVTMGLFKTLVGARS
jgi:arginase